MLTPGTQVRARAADALDGARHPTPESGSGASRPLLWVWGGEHWPGEEETGKGCPRGGVGSHLVFLDIRGLWVTAHVGVTHSRVAGAGQAHSEPKDSVPTAEAEAPPALVTWPGVGPVPGPGLCVVGLVTGGEASFAVVTPTG